MPAEPKISLDQPFAVIADIHGNSDALKAVLADIDTQGITKIINLGDHFSGPLASRETADILHQREMISIRGNHDRWLTEQAPADMGASDRVAFDQLDETDLDWLRSLPSTMQLCEEIFLCHGTPASDTTYWLETVLADGTVTRRDQSGIEAQGDGLNASLLLCGHTHLARTVRLSGNRLIVNPGSVGLPGYDDDLPVPHVVQSGNPDASYAIIQRQSGNWQVTFRLIPYDTSRMAQMAKDAGRLEWASAVETGWAHPE